MVKIGNIELGEFPLLLAPMEDVSDPPFRAVCKDGGADLMYTEFISSEGLIRDAIKANGPEPEKIVGQKYAQFTYYHTDERRPTIVTMRNVASREMLYCASSSGALYDQRTRELKGHKNVVEGIVANA